MPEGSRLPEAAPPGTDTSIDARLATLQAHIDRLYDDMPFGSHTVGVDGTFQHINHTELDWMGVTREALIGQKRPADFLTPDSQARLARHCANSGLVGFTDLELEMVGASGRHRFISVTTTGATRQADGSPKAYRSVSFDTSAKRQRKEQQQLAALAFDSLTGICVTDPNGVILRVNRAFCTLTGYSAAEVHGKNMHMISSGLHDPVFYRTMWESITARGQWQGEIFNRHKSGAVFAEWLNVSAVHNEAGGVTYYVGSFFDITATKAAQAEINHLAFFDALTQLPNRRMLQDRLALALANVVRTQVHGALLFIDLDNFKTLNDTRGHDLGDQLLIETGRRLRSAVREGDTVARIGGDEFVVLLNDLSPHSAEAAQLARQVSQHILETLASPYVFSDFEFTCTASLGITLVSPDSDAASALQQADMAMYQAKKSGRNTLRFFNPQMQTEVMNRVELEQSLNTALAKSQFVLVYQPQVDHQGHTVGAEALIRWNHPVHGTLSPAHFIPIAEGSDTIVRMGQWVLTTACAQLQQWSTRPLTRGLQLSVNVSARQFAQAEFVDQVLATLAPCTFDPSQLVLELTESLVRNVDDTREKMQALKAKGIGFSMDDFGTGYSSLSNLTQLLLDELKIDQSFVHSMGASASDEIVVQTIIAMANSLGLSVIAEGVETRDQQAMLARHGCLHYQGYLFSPPLPLAEFEAWLGANARPAAHLN